MFTMLPFKLKGLRAPLRKNMLILHHRKFNNSILSWNHLGFDNSSFKIVEKRRQTRKSDLRSNLSCAVELENAQANERLCIYFEIAFCKTFSKSLNSIQLFGSHECPTNVLFPHYLIIAFFKVDESPICQQFNFSLFHQLHSLQVIPLITRLSPFHQT